MVGDQFGDQFGANEWLVDEMYERYLQDPNSVDASWVALFSTTKPTTANSPATSATNTPRGGIPPTPKSAQSAPVIPVATPVVPQEVVRPSHNDRSSFPTNSW